MKKFFPILMMIVCATFVACDDDDDNGVAINSTVRSYIETKYPGADIRKAEYDKNGLLEVDFIHESIDKEAYFTTDNEWKYTEWDLNVADLPQVVKDAVTTAYPDFRIDDVDFVENPKGSFYEIEIEKGGAEQWIFATPEGELLESIPGSDSEIITTVKQFVTAKYEGAVIESAEIGKNGDIEVDFIHASIEKEACFDAAGKWLYTHWDVATANLPAVVKDVALSEYPDYNIDDVDFIESGSGEYYKLEMERGNYERTLFVTPTGEIVSQ